MSRSLYQSLVRAGAPVGTLGCTTRTLCGANGTGIVVVGCSHCVVSFMGLLAEFPILVCDLASGTDAIIGTDVLGSVLPHTLDMKNGLLFHGGGASLQLHYRNDTLSGHVFTVGHCSIPPYSEAVLHCTVRTAGGRVMPSSGILEGLTVFAESTGLVVGRTLVDPSCWRIPVLVSNFGQDAVIVEPFSEVGMVMQVSAIQAVTKDADRSSHGFGSLPVHLRDLLDQTSQQHQLPGVLLRYTDLFPTPGSTLTNHTDGVEHEIDTGDGTPIRCAPRRMSPQKMKKEEECVTEMLIVVFTGRVDNEERRENRFCVDYRKLNDVTVKDAYPLPRIDDTLDMLAGRQWFSTLDLASGYWHISLSREAQTKTVFATHSGLFSF